MDNIILKKEILTDSNLNSNEKIVLAYINSRNNPIFFETNCEISNNLKLPIRKIQRILSALEQKKYIKKMINPIFKDSSIVGNQRILLTNTRG
jgi:DNA-binding MarR family transcriptional regulator